MDKVSAEQEFDLRKNFNTKTSLVKKKQNNNNKKNWLQKDVLSLSFLSCWFILVELHACVASSKNIFPVYTSPGQRHYRIQTSADSTQKRFASLKVCTVETALQTWHKQYGAPTRCEKQPIFWRREDDFLSPSCSATLGHHDYLF